MMHEGKTVQRKTTKEEKDFGVYIGDNLKTKTNSAVC